MDLGYGLAGRGKSNAFDLASPLCAAGQEAQIPGLDCWRTGQEFGSTGEHHEKTASQFELNQERKPGSEKQIRSGSFGLAYLLAYLQGISDFPMDMLSRLGRRLL